MIFKLILPLIVSEEVVVHMQLKPLETRKLPHSVWLSIEEILLDPFLYESVANDLESSMQK